MAGLIQIIGYLLCVYLVFKGIEIFQIALMSKRESRLLGLLIGIATIVVSILIALAGIYFLDKQATSMSGVINRNSPIKHGRSESQPREYRATIIRRVALWAEPGGAMENSQPITFLEKDTRASVLHVLMDKNGAWIKVETTDGIIGWVESGVVKE